VENGVSVESELEDGLPPVQGDRVHLQQVILNLIINAIEAMSSVSEGPRELLISSSKAEAGLFVGRCGIPARYSELGLSSLSSTHFTRPSQAVWA
jgi:C4-dicarboxylate-specific signal transduction histidine kinase